MFGSQRYWSAIVCLFEAIGCVICLVTWVLIWSKPGPIEVGSFQLRSASLRCVFLVG